MLKKIVLVLLLLTLLASILVGGMVAYAQIIDMKVKTAESPKVGIPYDPGSFVVNVRGSNKYLKACFVVEVSDKKELEFLSENNHRVRDAVLEILRSRTEKDISSGDIQPELKKEITNSLKETLKIKSITDVYFTELVIQ